MRASTVAALGLAWLSGCGDSLVGGDCAPGYLEKEGLCVAPPGPDADGWQSAGGAGGEGDSGSGGRHEEVGGSGTQAGGTGPGGAGTGAGGPGSGGGSQCDPPLVACATGCVDTVSDAANCGGCGIVCASDICIDSHCEGETAGHLVVIGMDYRAVATDTPAAILLGNGVFMAAHEPVRIIDFRQWASNTGPNKVRTIIKDEAKSRGRTVTFISEVDANEVAGMLASGDADVLLVNHQDQAPAGVLGPAGASWAAAIQSFGQVGGVVVTLAVAGDGNEMPALLTSAGILQTSALADESNEPLYNQGFLDALGQNVISPFLGKTSTASIATAELPGPELSVVITTDVGAPVAVHKIIAP